MSLKHVIQQILHVMFNYFLNFSILFLQFLEDTITRKMKINYKAA